LGRASELHRRRHRVRLRARRRLRPCIGSGAPAIAHRVRHRQQHPRNSDSEHPSPLGMLQNVEDCAVAHSSTIPVLAIPCHLAGQHAKSLAAQLTADLDVTDNLRSVAHDNNKSRQEGHQARSLALGCRGGKRAGERTGRAAACDQNGRVAVSASLATLTCWP
jgi:hypothetical protein